MRIHELNERVLNPGERKEIKLKLDAYKKKLKELDNYMMKLSTLSSWREDNPELMQQVKDLQDKYQAVIDQLQAELDKPASKDNLDKLIEGIKKNCSEIVRAYQDVGDFLYRGTNETVDAFYGRPYEVRKPKDSNAEFDKAFNDLLREIGVKARRDNSVFCSGSRSQASGYGTAVYMIFPRNGFSFTWSQNTGDLVINNEAIQKCFDRNRMLELYQKLKADEQFDEYKKEVYNMGYYLYDEDEGSVGRYDGFMGVSRWSKDLRTIENMIYDQTLDDSYKEYTEWKSYLSPEALVKNFYLKTDDIESAIRSEKEVFVNADYYAIKTNSEKRVRQLLGMPGYY